MSPRAVYTDTLPNPRAAAAALLTAILALGIFFAGLDDGLHLFQDQYGQYQLLITSNVTARLLPSLILSSLVILSAWLAASAVGSRLTGIPLSTVAQLAGPAFMPFAILFVTPLRYAAGIAGSSAATFLLSTTLSSALLL